MLSISEYAKQKQISYQAVNQQIKRCQKELKGHIIKKGKTRFLDDEAIEFLNQKRKENPVTVVQEGRTERIEELQEQVKVLTARIVDLQDRLIRSKDTIEQLQADNIKLLTAAAAAAQQEAVETPVGAGEGPVSGEGEELQGEVPEGPGNAPQEAVEGVQPDQEQRSVPDQEQTTTGAATSRNRFIRAFKVLIWGKE